MQNYFQAIIPVLFLIAIGFIAKQMKLIDADIARKLIKFLFTIPLPIIVFFGFATNKVSINDMALPLISILLSSSLMLISFIVAKLLKLSRQRTGTILVAAGVTSTLLYVLPLVSFFYGAEGAKYLYLFDFGNGLLTWTVVYYVAGTFGNKKDVHISKTLISFIKNPMLWALLVGIVVGAIGVTVPTLLLDVSKTLSGFTNPLILICIGVFLDFAYFRNKKNILDLIVTAVLVMGCSFLLAIGLTNLFVLPELARKVVLMCALAPAAGLTVAFSAEHNLDLEFASAIVALTMALGVLLIPFLALI